MNFVCYKKIACLAVCVIFTFACETTSFGMNEEVRKEIKYFWDKKTPWAESVERTIELDKVFLSKSEFPCENLSIVKYYYEFYSKMYPVGRYIQKKVFLENKKTGQKRLLKSFEDHGDLISIIDYDNKKELIDKNSGLVINEKN